MFNETTTGLDNAANKAAADALAGPAKHLPRHARRRIEDKLIEVMPIVTVNEDRTAVHASLRDMEPVSGKLKAWAVSSKLDIDWFATQSGRGSDGMAVGDC